LGCPSREKQRGRICRSREGQSERELKYPHQVVDGVKNFLDIKWGCLGIPLAKQESRGGHSSHGEVKESTSESPSIEGMVVVRGREGMEWKTIELITRDFWWPGIMTFVKAYIKGCTTCQTTKIKPPVKVPLKPNEVPQGIWETITMDFITDLPVSNGYDLILMVVD
jgi:hypothetical protein